LLDFVRSFYDTCPPDFWPVQYREAMAERGEGEGEEEEVMEEDDN